ncbi:MAG TPA: hypothetical protein VFT22_21280 [Kofleriaceae bacterium]|nr:hypothetical protein [Kofleriaceae bacterium]
MGGSKSSHTGSLGSVTFEEVYAEDRPVKILKLVILISGALGLAGMLMSGVGAMLSTDKANTIIMLVAFGLPVLMGLAALGKPPLMAWQAGVSLACFGLTAVKLRLWETIKFIGDVPVELKMMMVGAGLGVIVSVLALVKPEASA